MMVQGMERLIGSAKLYEAAITKRGATRSDEEWRHATPDVETARQHLQEAVLELGVVMWLARLDD